MCVLSVVFHKFLANFINFNYTLYNMVFVLWFTYFYVGLNTIYVFLKEIRKKETTNIFVYWFFEFSIIAFFIFFLFESALIISVLGFLVHLGFLKQSS